MTLVSLYANNVYGLVIPLDPRFLEGTNVSGVTTESLVLGILNSWHIQIIGAVLSDNKELQAFSMALE